MLTASTVEIRQKEHIRRLEMIQKSELNARNNIMAIGVLAVSVLRKFWYY